MENNITFLFFDKLRFYNQIAAKSDKNIFSIFLMNMKWTAQSKLVVKENKWFTGQTSVVMMEITGAGSVRVTEVPAAPEWRAATPQSF